MTQIELARYIKDYTNYFTQDWKYEGTRFWRRKDRWIELVEFRARPHEASYLPVHCFIYLKDPILLRGGKEVAPNASSLIQELKCGTPNPVKCEILIESHQSRIIEVWHLMLLQFYPKIDEGLNPDDVYRGLALEPQTWHPLLVLCQHAAELGLRDLALEYYTKFAKETVGYENDWILGPVKRHLENILKLLDNNSSEVQSILDRLEKNLKLLRLKD
jgi:hypothetical protein